MAKFRQGDLVLTSTQRIIQGSETLIDEYGVASFSKMTINGATNVDSLGVSGFTDLTTLDVSGLSTLDSLTFDSGGATIDKISTLLSDSATELLTDQAIKTYVDAQVGGAVPAGVDEALVRYNGINSVQDSGIFIDDSDNVTGINDLNVDGTATVSASLFCDDLYVSGDTIFVGAGEIKSTGGNVELYYAGNKKFETSSLGATITGLLTTDNAFIDDNGILTFGAGLDGRLYSDGTDFFIDGGVDRMAIFRPGGACVLYQNNYPALSTTATGIKIMDSIGDNTFLEFFDDSSNQLGSISMKAGIVNEFAISFSGETLMLGKEDGSVALYYDNSIAIQTTVDGADIRDTSGANAKLNLSASNGTPMAVLQTTSTTTNDLWISATQSAGNIYLATQTSSVGIKVEDQGAVEFYYDNAKVGETTAAGISGAVWG